MRLENAKSEAMLDVAPPDAMLEVRARALHTRRSLADSARSLTVACEMVRRFLYAEARATSFSRPRAGAREQNAQVRRRLVDVATGGHAPLASRDRTLSPQHAHARR